MSLNQDKYESPWEKSGILSKAFYCWMNKIFLRAHKTSLTNQDIFPLPESEKADLNTTRLEREWSKEINKKSPYLFLAIMRMFKWELFISGICYLIEVMTLTIRPIILQRILIGFRDIKEPSNLVQSVIFSFALILNAIISVFFRDQGFWFTYRMGLRLRVAASSLIFKKMLRLNQKGMAEATSGQIINLLSTDAQKYELTFLFLHYIWIGPIQAIIVFYLMSKIALVPSLCSISVILLFIPLQSGINHFFAKMRLKTALVADQRVRIISDIITGIQVVKFHAWEYIYLNLVNAIRNEELKFLFRGRICQALRFSQLLYQIKVAVTVLLITTVILNKNDEDPDALRSYHFFTLLNFILSLFMSLTLFMPFSIEQIYETEISCKRMKKFLCLPEANENNLPQHIDSPKPFLRFLDVHAEWSKDDKIEVLNSISFECSGPQLVAIVGPVGCGKSSLLQAALGELPISTGKITRSSDVSYCPQFAWLFPGTVRENILCGLPYEPDRYSTVLSVTTLDKDIANFPCGDQTQVGERGVSLSGGQKARIGLARICYSQSKLILLDDPLAAVDANVAKHIFEQCIKTFLSDRLILLVTHQHHLLHQMDKILSLKEGKLKFFGNYAELIAQENEYSQSECPSKQKIIEFDNSNQNYVNSDISLMHSADNQYYQSEVNKQRIYSNIEPTNQISSKDYSLNQSNAISNHINQNVDQIQSIAYDYKLYKNRSIDQSIADSLLLTMSLPSIKNYDHKCLDNFRYSSFQIRNKTIQKNPKLTRSLEDKMNIHTMINQPSETSKKLTYSVSNRKSIRSRSRNSYLSDFALSIENAAQKQIAEQLDLNANNDIMEIDPNYTDFKEEETMEVEELQHGVVSWKHYLIYGRMGGGLCGTLFVGVMFIIAIMSFISIDLWITRWLNIVDQRKINLSDNSSIIMVNQTDIWSDNYFNLYVLCGLTTGLVIVGSIRSLLFFTVLLNAAKRLHECMLKSCLLTRIHFFETNTSGRILNRFSKDIGLIDDLLPVTLHDFLQCLSLVLIFSIVTLISTYWVIIPLIPLSIVFHFTRKYYLNASRDLKRMEAIARSPVFTLVNVTLQGLPCIRAAKNEKSQLNMFFNIYDEHTSIFYLNVAAARWLSMRLDFLCTLYISCVVIICLILGIYSDISSANVGLMISYSTSLIGLFQWCVRQSAEVENQMVSIERVVEYMNLAPEHTELPELILSDEEWPSSGHIQFENLCLRYVPNGTLALKGITLDIKPGSKVGIVGRTGAGKSSLISALFRLVEPESGRILIDGVDIGQMKLESLREKISVIPQNPAMFTGTIRMNLDPGQLYSDEEIWKALATVRLEKVISHLQGGLNSLLNEGGSNFSTGQRQLLALARAILLGNRILVVDEATANIDPGTDAIIQKTLRSQFVHCTVLTVAHRLHTIIDSDYVVVMENGLIVEYGLPHELLNPQLAAADQMTYLSTGNLSTELDPNKNFISSDGPLASLVKQTGPEESFLLACSARKSYLEFLIKRIGHHDLKEEDETKYENHYNNINNSFNDNNAKLVLRSKV